MEMAEGWEHPRPILALSGHFRTAAGSARHVARRCRSAITRPWKAEVQMRRSSNLEDVTKSFRWSTSCVKVVLVTFNRRADIENRRSILA